MLSDTLLRWTRRPRYLIDGFSYALTSHGVKLRELKDRYAGRAMIVVGSGPSLNKTPLDQFAGIPSIGMNKIDMIFERTAWRPSLIIAVNNLVVHQHAESYSRSEIPVYVSWKARWMLPRRIRGKVNFFNSLLDHEFSGDITKGVGSAGTVTYTCLQFAHYMGANPVILLGIDHSFNTNSSLPTIERRKGPDSNHFDPNYFSAGTLWGIPNLERSEMAYRIAKDMFERSGRKVFDATVGGKLNVFEKISLEQAFEICGR